MIKSSDMQVVNDADDYKDVDVYITTVYGAEWLFTLSRDNTTMEVLDDATPRYAANSEDIFEECANVPAVILAEFVRIRPQALAMLTGDATVVRNAPPVPA